MKGLARFGLYGAECCVISAKLALSFGYKAGVCGNDDDAGDDDGGDDGDCD